MADEAPAAPAAPQPSIEARMAAIASRDNPVARGEAGAAVKAARPAPVAAVEAPEAEDAPASPAETSEITADDLPEAEPQGDGTEDEGGAPPADEFEIVHNGTQVKLDRAKTIELAQKGFDYERKTQAVAAQQQEAAQLLNQVRAVAQVEPLLAQERATIASLEGQLKPWLNVDWVQLASEQPLEYPRYRAQFDALQQTYHQARGVYEQKAQAVSQATQQINMNMTRQEMAKLASFEGMGTQAGYQKAVTTIQKYARAEGYTAEELQQVMDSRYVKTLLKAAKYDELVAAKRSKIGQIRDAPPVARPGAPEPPQLAGQRQYKAERQALKKSGSMADAARILARLPIAK